MSTPSIKIGWKKFTQDHTTVLVLLPFADKPGLSVTIDQCLQMKYVWMHALIINDKGGCRNSIAYI